MHSKHSLQEHRQENHVHAHERRPEMHLAPEIVHHSASRLREPVIDASKERENSARRDNIMEMSDDVVGIVQIEIGGIKCEWDPGESADAEHRQKCGSKKHRDGKPN